MLAHARQTDGTVCARNASLAQRAATDILYPDGDKNAESLSLSSRFLRVRREDK